jgi:flagellar biosynthesis protein FliQ
MTEDTALQLVSQMLWAGVMIIAPLLLLTMLVGVVVSILQVVTQIQEVSLSFIPKIFAVVLVLALFGPWMLKRLVAYSAAVITSIPGTL